MSIVRSSLRLRILWGACVALVVTGLKAGEYTVDVNGTVTTFTLAQDN